MNRVCMVGRITKDPEVRNVKGNECCNFQIAVKRSYASPDGKYESDFFNCAAWGGSATFLGNYVKKGYILSVDGSLKNNPYKGKDGNTVRSEVIQCKEVNNLTPRATSQQGNNQQRQQQPPKNNNNQQQGGYNQNSNSYNQNNQTVQNKQSNQSYSTAPGSNYNSNQQKNQRNFQPQNNQNNNQSFNTNVIDDDLPF